MKQQTWRAIAGSLALVGAFAAAPAHAVLSLDPSSTGVIAQNLGLLNCEPDCIYTTFGLTNGPSPADDLRLYYQSDAPSRTAGNGAGIDSGLFAANYDTTFANSFFNPQAALIDYVGGLLGPAIACPDCYLAIKDGNQDPSYYFYDLAAWNGRESILLHDFWPGAGSITHIAIWGRNPANNIPEPGTLMLGGLGLLALMGARRPTRPEADDAAA